MIQRVLQIKYHFINAKLISIDTTKENQPYIYKKYMLYGKALYEPSQAKLNLASAWLSFLNQAELSQDLKLSLD